MTEWIEIIFRALRIGFAFSVIIILLYFSHSSAYQYGRQQYHQEMLRELEAKGGAPVLIYPPDNMFEFPQRD